MSIIVETGAVVAGANSYISVADANTYHSTYGNTDWDATGATDYTAALIVATQALDAFYGQKYMSAITVGSPQSLLWPRLIFWDKYGRIRQGATVPTEIKQAQAEFALLYANGTDLFPQLDPNNQLLDQTTKIGEMMIKTVYVKPTPVANFRKVDLILAPILNTGSSGNRVR